MSIRGIKRRVEARVPGIARAFQVMARRPLLGLALFALPSLAFVAGAIDFANAEIARADLQSALNDAAAAAIVEIGAKSDDEVSRTVKSVTLKGLYPEQDLENLVVSVDRKSRKLKCLATVRVETTLISLIGPEFLDVSASTELQATH